MNSRRPQTICLRASFLPTWLPRTKMAEAALLRVLNSGSPRVSMAVPLTMNPLRRQNSVLVCRHLSACAWHPQRTVSRSVQCRRYVCSASAPLTQRLVASCPRCPQRMYSVEATSDSDGSPVRRMMPFEEYRKLKKALKLRARMSGLPMAGVGILASAALNTHFNPNLLAPVPEEEIQLIL